MYNSIIIRASALTAHVLGLKKIVTKATTFQAYLMLGNKCDNNCLFCSQANTSETDQKFLSRITWLQFKLEALVEAIKINLQSKSDAFKKICFQVVSYKNSFQDFLYVLKTLRESISIPISASLFIHSIEDMDILFKNGLSRLGIAIDCANSEIFKIIKESGLERKLTFEEMKKLVIAGSKKYLNKIAVHIIAGLGESDKDIIYLIKELLDNNVIVALFAFTPLSGTKMKTNKKISIDRYRKIQVAQYLLNNKVSLDHFKFDAEGNLIKVENFDELWHKHLQMGEFMKTSGCPLCSRPYYNDSPTDKELFNYFDTIAEEEINKWHEKLKDMFI